MYSLRRLLERFSDHLILKRRTPKEFGRHPMYVTLGSALKYWRLDLGKIDPDLLRLAHTHVHPGNKVWDIGANVGLFSFAAAGIVGTEGQVVALEPDTRLVEIIRKSLRLSRKQQSAARHPATVGGRAEIEISRFSIAARGRSANHLTCVEGSSQTGGTSASYPVMTVTMDWLLEKYGKPDLVKIDVEGAERLVLQSGKRILEEARPIIMCEVSDYNSAYIYDLLQKNRYTLFDWEKNDGKPIQSASFNTLALPQG